MGLSKRWYIKFPADASALGPITFPDAVDEKQVKQFARDFEGSDKLPAGFECWPTNDEF